MELVHGFTRRWEGYNPMKISPGYRHFIINPQVPTGVTWANISKETPYGTVTVKWRLKEAVQDGFEYSVADSHLYNSKDCEKYTLNGKRHKISQSSVEIESGKYSFAWDSPTGNLLKTNSEQ